MAFDLGKGILGGGMMGFGDSDSGEYGKLNDIQHKYYDPYVQQGQQAGDLLRGQYDPMTSDPSGYLDGIMKNYKPTEQYQQRREEALGAMSNTAAAGGIRGTQQDQLSQGRMADRLMGEDMQQYLNNVLGIQKTGMEGERDFYNKGYDASGRLEQGLSNVLGTKMTRDFQGNQQQMQMLSDLLKLLATS